MTDQQSATPGQSAIPDRAELAEPSDPEPSSTNVDGANLPVVFEPQRKQPGFLQRLAYLFRPQANATTRENLQDALAAASVTDQTISADERAMLHNILRLREVRVVDVMVPRGDIEAVDLQTTLAELLKLFETSGHSRMPVYHDTLDDPRGMVHIRDVMGYLTRTGKKRSRRKTAMTTNGTAKANGNGASKTNGNGAAPAGLDLAKIDLEKTIGELKLTRDVLFVPPSMLASDLMARMQAQRIQMALVIDEYGGTDGLVSLEDIVEMVVGDIEDEHDEIEVQIERVDDNTLIVDARAELPDIGRELGAAFVEAARREEGDVDTIGGLIFSLLGHVPVRGEVVPAFAGYEMEILNADPRRIGRVRLVRARQHLRRGQSRREATHATPSAPAALPAPDTPPGDAKAPPS